MNLIEKKHLISELLIAASYIVKIDHIQNVNSIFHQLEEIVADLLEVPIIGGCRVEFGLTFIEQVSRLSKEKKNDGLSIYMYNLFEKAEDLRHELRIEEEKDFQKKSRTNQVNTDNL